MAHDALRCQKSLPLLTVVDASGIFWDIYWISVYSAAGQRNIVYVYQVGNSLFFGVRP